MSNTQNPKNQNSLISLGLTGLNKRSSVLAKRGITLADILIDKPKLFLGVPKGTIDLIENCFRCHGIFGIKYKVSNIETRKTPPAITNQEWKKHKQRGIEYRKQIDRATKALRQNPNNVKAYLERGRVYLEHMHFFEAVNDLEKAIALDPDNLNSRIYLGDAYRGTGQYEKAREVYSMTILKYPFSAKAFAHRGDFYFWNEKYDNSIEDLDKAIFLDTENSIYYFYRGRTHRTKGDLQKAITDFSKMIELEPIPSNFQRRAGIYFQAGEFDKAADDYNQGILESSRSREDEIFSRGIYLFKKGLYQNAIEKFNEIIEQGDAGGVVYLYNGLAYERLDYYQKASENYNRAANIFYDEAVDADYDAIPGNIIGEMRKLLISFDYRHFLPYFCFKIAAGLGKKKAQDFLKRKGIEW